MSDSKITPSDENSTNPKAILLAKGQNDLGIELVYGDKIRLIPARLSQPFQATQLMEAVLQVMQEVIESHFRLANVLLDQETITTISDENHRPVTQIFIREGTLDPGVCSTLTNVGMEFVGIISGHINSDMFRNSQLDSRLLEILYAHTSEFIQIYGNTTIRTEFIVQAPDSPDSAIAINGRYISVPADTKSLPISGCARPDGLSISGNTLSLIINEKPTTFHITDMQQIHLTAEAVISGRQLTYTGKKIQRRGKRDSYRLDSLQIDHDSGSLI